MTSRLVIVECWKSGQLVRTYDREFFDVSGAVPGIPAPDEDFKKMALDALANEGLLGTSVSDWHFVIRRI